MEQIEQLLQLFPAVDRPLAQHLLQCPEEAPDAPAAKMADMANTAAITALGQVQTSGKVGPQIVVVDNIKWFVPVVEKNGTPYVPTAYPTGVIK